MQIVAVVVTYHPKFETLGALLDSLKPQVNFIVVVDNGSGEKLVGWLERYYSQSIHGIFLGTNTGVGVAHNTGIAWARQRGAECVALFDQDSLPAAGMIHRLAEVIQKKQAEGSKVAAVGPRYTDERQGNPPPFIQVRSIKLIRQSCSQPTSIVEVDYLISSGSLIPISTLATVGLMREDLFVDYVDIEWGLRARNKGFQSYGVCSAEMKHDLGERPISFFGKQIPLHSPLRHYYHFRNAVLLYQQRWLPINWKCVDGWKLFLKYVFYSIFAKPRLAHFRMMTLGVWHGLVGKSGKFDGDSS